MYITHIFEVVPELLEAVVPGDVRSEKLQLVHVHHESHSGAPPGSASTRQEQGAPGGSQDTIHAGHVVQHLVEEEDV